jgi:TolB-like protein/DNA-binding SARP family transcriptional activator/Tfp pilus assembly protein PilF
MMVSTFRLRAFGSLQLHAADGEEIAALLAQPRRIALLAYLLVAAPRDFQRRDKLLALFWPEQDEQRARNALNQALHFIRRSLGSESIVTRGDGEIAIDRALIWCDVLAFETALREGRIDEALELYRGPFLDGFHLSAVAAELDQWMESERAGFAQRHRQALEQMAAEREAAGDPSGAAVWLRKVAAGDPFAAGPALRLMRALAAAGDRAAALHHARVHELLVREELGAPVDPEIAALVHRLQTERPAERVESAPPESASAIERPVPISKAWHTEAPRSSRIPSWWRRRVVPIGVVVALAVIGAMTIVYRARVGHPDPVISSIAVLPFENLTGDRSKEYLADVMTDALITELARYKRLIVKSRTSITQYKGVRRPIGEIAKALEADAIIEGTLTGSGRSIQVTAQLIYAPNDRHLWGDTFVRDSADVLAVEGDIANAIAHEVRQLTSPRALEPRPRLTRNADAYALYLRGQSAMLSRTPRAVNEARAYFRQSIALDSTFALGYAGVADLFIISGADGYLPLRFARDSAHLFAARSVKLDSTLSEGHTALAAAFAEEANWVAADREFRRAIDLGPSNALARHWYAHYLAIRGRLDSARTQVNIGLQIDPISASLRSTAGAIEIALGVAKPSSQLAVQNVMRDPLHAWTRASYARRLSLERKCAEARAQIDTAKDLVPDNLRMLMSVFAVEWRCGDRTKAKTMFEGLKRRPDAHAKGLWIATVYNGWGQRDSAYAWLDSTEWNGDMRFNFLIGPDWGAARKDPRFPRILRQMGLAQ